MGSLDESSGGKTPISLLQELCNKREVTPQYDLVANEGAIHEPLFVFKVSAGDIVATGKGQSKKKAKHNAAVAALQLMGATCKDVTKVEYIKNDEDEFSNPVGDLQEATQKKNWPPPIYEYSEGDGPPHARDFICNIKLFHYAEQATGKSKKGAKRAAAGVMLRRIKEGSLAPSDVHHQHHPKRHYDYDQHLHEENQSIEICECPDTSNSLPNSSRPLLEVNSQRPPAPERKKITPMFQTASKTKLSRMVESLHKLNIPKLIRLYDEKLLSLNSGKEAEYIVSQKGKRWENQTTENILDGNHFTSENDSEGGRCGIDFGDWVFPDWESIEEKVDSHIYAEKFLKRLSDDENFQFDFYFSKKKSPDGLEMCLVRLTTNPFEVGCGMGGTRDCAKYHSIFSILSHLQILTKKSLF